MKLIYSHIGRAIMAYDKHFKVFMKRELEPAGMNVAEAMVMMALFEEDCQTQEQLLSVLHYDKSVMTRTIQSLEAAGRIARHAKADDARSAILEITAAGQDMKPVILEALRNWCRMAFAGMDEGEEDQLLKTMQKVLGNIESCE